jgi:hypothetical protein
VKVEFVNSSENDSDIFTKNVSQDTYQRHAGNFLGVLKILGVNERFGLGRVLKRYPLRSFKIRFYMFRLSIRDIYN